MAPVCDTVTVSEQDASMVSVQSISGSGGVGSATITAVLKNEITGGSGETISDTFEVTVDGTVEHSEQLSIDPGEEVEMNINIESISSGWRNICAEFTDNSCTSIQVDQPSDGGSGGDDDPNDGGGGSDDPDGGTGGDGDGGNGDTDEGQEGGGIPISTLGALATGAAAYLMSRGDSGE